MIIDLYIDDSARSLTQPKNKGKSKVIFDENFQSEICRNTDLLTENLIVDIYIDDSAEGRTKSKNKGKSKVIFYENFYRRVCNNTKQITEKKNSTYVHR